MAQLLAVLIDGLIYSSWLFIIAVGLTLIYGVMKILNIAHGSLYALGAYSAASLAGYWINHGYPPMGSYAVMLVAAILVGLIAGPIIERGLLRFMYGKDEIVLVLVTYAVFLILEDFVKLVWGVDPYFIAQPYGLLGSFSVGDLTYPNYNLVLFGAAVFIGVVLAWVNNVLTRLSCIACARSGSSRCHGNTTPFVASAIAASMSGTMAPTCSKSATRATIMCAPSPSPNAS